MELLEPTKGERILDIGCGAGALAPTILRANAQYIGLDLSPKLIAIAKKHHGTKAGFLVADATRLPAQPAIVPGSFNAATFLLSLQDISPLDTALASAAWAVKADGRLVILMTHPCFRIPRQSGWGWDEERKLRYRRIDRYMTPLDIPMQEYGGPHHGTTRSYHRPLQQYVAALGEAGFLIDSLKEVPAAPPKGLHGETKAERLARTEIPLFIGLRARRR